MPTQKLTHYSAWKCDVKVRLRILKRTRTHWTNEAEEIVVQSPIALLPLEIPMPARRHTTCTSQNEVRIIEWSNVECDYSEIYVSKCVSRDPQWAKSHGVVLQDSPTTENNFVCKRGHQLWLLDPTHDEVEGLVNVVNLTTCLAGLIRIQDVCWYPTHQDADGLLWTLCGAKQYSTSQGAAAKVSSWGIAQSVESSWAAGGSLLLSSTDSVVRPAELLGRTQSKLFGMRLRLLHGHDPRDISSLSCNDKPTDRRPLKPQNKGESKRKFLIFKEHNPANQQKKQHSSGRGLQIPKSDRCRERKHAGQRISTAAGYFNPAVQPTGGSFLSDQAYSSYINNNEELRGLIESEESNRALSNLKTPSQLPDFQSPWYRLQLQGPAQEHCSENENNCIFRYLEPNTFHDPQKQHYHLTPSNCKLGDNTQEHCVARKPFPVSGGECLRARIEPGHTCCYWFQEDLPDANVDNAMSAYAQVDAVFEQKNRDLALGGHGVVDMNKPTIGTPQISWPASPFESGWDDMDLDQRWAEKEVVRWNDFWNGRALMQDQDSYGIIARELPQEGESSHNHTFEDGSVALASDHNNILYWLGEGAACSMPEPLLEGHDLRRPRMVTETQILSQQTIYTN